MKIFRRIFLSVIGLLIIAWVIPVKITINNNFNIDDYLEDESVVLLCHGKNSTDVQFVVEQYSGIEQCPRYIKKLEGNSPELFLNRQIDDNYDDVNFLFIGHFNDEITDLDKSYTFYAKKWYTVGNIDRRFNLLWYPPYGFNIFEIDL